MKASLKPQSSHFEHSNSRGAALLLDLFYISLRLFCVSLASLFFSLRVFCRSVILGLFGFTLVSLQDQTVSVCSFVAAHLDWRVLS